jgi:hypothetical protein
MSVIKRTIITIFTAALLGAIVALLSPGNFLAGWLAAFVLMAISIYCLLAVWQWGGGSRKLAAMVALAFLLRLGVGVVLTQVLPSYGFDDPQQKSGYVFYDSFRRDDEAWDLAQSNAPILKSFQNEFASDQYGGLLSLSALVYRYLSPDTQRPDLIIILAAFAAALGVPFFYRAVSGRWNEKLASLAAWIVVLYPDGILFGSSQMREPFLVGFLCIAIWGVLALKTQRRASILALGLSLIGMGLISSRVAAAVLVALAVWFFLESRPADSTKKRWLQWAALALGGLLVLAFSWEWLRTSSAWDLLVTETGSGWVTKVIAEVGSRWRIPFITVYGLVQPVLPAAIADPTRLVWKIIAILRAVGWYALAPFLIYGFYSVLKVKDSKEKSVLMWISGFLLLWLVVSSIRAGGDQWDNPRYRSMFLPWLALMAAWGIRWALEHRDLWLARMLAIEIIFVGFFTDWYFSRYLLLWKRLPFWENVVWVGGLTALVLMSGWIWDISKWLIARTQKERIEPGG